MRRWLLPACAAALLVPAAGARASMVSTFTPDAQIGTAGLSVEGAPGEVNQIQVTYSDPASAGVTDVHSPLTAGPGCVSIDAHRATCTTGTGPLDVIDATLGDANDSFTVDTNGHVALASLAVAGGAGDDVIDASHAAITTDDHDRFFLVDLEGGSGRDRIRGTSAPDSIGGGGGRDVLRGGPGADLLDGDGEGADETHVDTPAPRETIDGGAGSDTVSYAAHPRGVTVDLAHPHTAGSRHENDRLSSIENVIGTTRHDVLRGDGGRNRLEGWAYEPFATSPLAGDTIAGRGGNDTLVGTSRADVFSGDTGRDTVDLGGGADHADCGAALDTVAVANAGLPFPSPHCERLDDGSYRFRGFNVSGGAIRAALAADDTSGAICHEELHVTRNGVALGDVTWDSPVPASLAVPLNAAGLSAAAHHRIVLVKELGCTGSPHSWRLRL